MKRITRRNFIKTTALVTTAASNSRILGANGRINVGFIGTGKMGQGNMGPCGKQPNTHITWVCDVWDDNIQIAMRDNPQARATKNFLEVLDDKDLQAVCIATPDHWHALMTVMAMERGLHVYCEKPIAHSTEELKVMIRAQQRYNRVFQAGMWQNSDQAFIEALDIVQSKHLGEVTAANAFFYGGGSIGITPDSEPPSSLGQFGWDWWIGPAAWRPFNWIIFQSDPVHDSQHKEYAKFRHFWDYASGMLGDWGPHLLAPLLMGMGAEGPLTISSHGSIGCGHDMRETPNVWLVTADLLDPISGRTIKVTFDHSECKSTPQGKRDTDSEFIYESGARIRVNRGTFELIDENGRTIKSIGHDTGKAIDNHWRDFVRNIRNDQTNTRTSLSNIAQSHYLMLAAAALQRGRPNSSMEWDYQNNNMKNPDPDVQRYLDFNYRQPWQMPKV